MELGASASGFRFFSLAADECRHRADRFTRYKVLLESVAVVVRVRSRIMLTGGTGSGEAEYHLTSTFLGEDDRMSTV